jgi:oxygen-independent coproporphyrinogen-3 oxidase
LGRGTRARHLYAHLPFCGHRCGYCDFVTLVGRGAQHGGYVEALLAELDLERGQLAESLETVFVGGGTPTFTEPRALARLLRSLPAARETTVEANPETVSSALAFLLLESGVTRISLGAQSFQQHLLTVLERRAQPEDVRRAVYSLRDVGFDNVSLDLIYGIPGQSTADLEHDLDEALALEPEHLSCYELEAKPGTRFTHRYADELARQADAMETYFERIVARLTDAGYRWYETANFCLEQEAAGGRDLRAHHNLAYWRGRDYVGLGIGAVSTLGATRYRNTPRLTAYLAALADNRRPPREVEELDAETRGRERLMLGLRLDEPVAVDDGDDSIDRAALARLEGLRLAAREQRPGGEWLRLTTRGRFVGGGVTAELLR